VEIPAAAPAAPASAAALAAPTVTTPPAAATSAGFVSKAIGEPGRTVATKTPALFRTSTDPLSTATETRSLSCDAISATVCGPIGEIVSAAALT